MSDDIAWLDGIDPQRAIRACGAKMGRLAELQSAGLRVPQGFTVTADAYRRHCAKTGLDEVIDAALGGLSSDAETAAIQTAVEAVQAELYSREMSADLAGLVTGAYGELSSRCLGLNVPAAVRSSATGEDSATASFAGMFDTFLGVCGDDLVLEAVRRCWASLFGARAVAYRLRAGLHHWDMPMAVGVVELIHAQASGVARSASPVTGKTDRVVIETNWGWGEAVMTGLVTPDYVEVGKTDGRTLRYRVATKKVISALDYAAGRVVQSDMPARLVDQRVLDDEQIAAVVDAVLAIERYYGCPVDVEWVLDKYRRAGEPVCIVQARPVTVTSADPDPMPAAWDPAAMVSKYVFKR